MIALHSFEVSVYKVKIVVVTRFGAPWSPEPMPAHEARLNVVERGAVGRLGRILVPWGYWGEARPGFGLHCSDYF